MVSSDAYLERIGYSGVTDPNSDTLRVLHRAHMFTVPFEIERWSAYGTGFYNELVIVDLIAELESVGLAEEANTLRGFWERKVTT